MHRTACRRVAWQVVPAVLIGVLVVPAWIAPVGAVAAPGSALIRGVPSVRQEYNLSCEYAAAHAVTLFWGRPVPEQTFLREVARNPNPHLGFRGDINGLSGGIDDYGVYAEPLMLVLEHHGFDATVFYGGIGRLEQELARGNPVVAWITVNRSIDRPVYTETYAGRTFKLVPGEHAVVLYGYDGYGVYAMDVSTGGYYHTPWDSFLRRWSYFDQMALVITPR